MKRRRSNDFCTYCDSDVGYHWEFGNLVLTDVRANGFAE